MYYQLPVANHCQPTDMTNLGLETYLMIPLLVEVGFLAKVRTGLESFTIH